MENVLAALLGALVGLGGVAAGAWLQGRREHERWLRNEKLNAAVSFIATTGAIYDEGRSTGAASRSADDDTRWDEVQKARSALYLLCNTSTVDMAEELVRRVRRAQPATGDGNDDATLKLLRRLVRQLRRELGVTA